MPGHDERSVADEIRRRMEASPFHARMGINVDAVREGQVDLRLEAREDHVNLMGSVHGGVLATLADVAAGLAVRSAIPDGTDHVSVHLDVQYLSPGPTGHPARHGTRRCGSVAASRSRGPRSPTPRERCSRRRR